MLNICPSTSCFSCPPFLAVLSCMVTDAVWFLPYFPCFVSHVLNFCKNAKILLHFPFTLQVLYPRLQALQLFLYSGVLKYLVRLILSWLASRRFLSRFPNWEWWVACPCLVLLDINVVFQMLMAMEVLSACFLSVVHLIMYFCLIILIYLVCFVYIFLFIP